MKSVQVSIAALLSLATSLTCQMQHPENRNESGTALVRITVAGSTAMLPLVAEAANAYMRSHSGVAIDVEGGGSSRGIACAQKRECAIGMSDVLQNQDSFPTLEEHRVAIVTFAAMANLGPFNDKIASLSLEQMKSVFTGTITNWAELGGGNQPIVVVNRKKGSGTRATFGQIVLGSEAFVEGPEQESNGLVRTMLETTPGAISYLALAYKRDTVLCLGVNGIAATNENVALGKYPIWSFERLYTLGKPQGAVRNFIDYLKTQDVQASIVPKSGFLAFTAAPESLRLGQ